MGMFTKTVNIGRIVNMAFSEPAEWIVRYFKQFVPVTTAILTGAENLAISMDNGLEHRFAIKRYSSLSQERARDLIVNWQAPSPRTQLLVAVTELAPRTRDLLREHRYESLSRIGDAITSRVAEWIGGAEQPDDVTVVLARAR